MQSKTHLSLHHSVSLALAGALLLSTTAAGQVTFTWQGDNNNNWQNSANWSQSPGSGDVPDSPSDFVRFRDSANRHSVDVNGANRDVGGIDINVNNHDYLFKNGTIQLSGDLDVVATGETIEFDPTLTLRQMSAGNWTNNGGNLLVSGKLTGAGDIHLSGNATFSNSNPYTGNLTIDGGTTLLLNANALSNASVWVNSNLDVSQVDSNIGALGGYGGGSVKLGSRSLTVGGNNASITYHGDFDEQPDSEIHKVGTGSWTLKDLNSYEGTLYVESGTVVLEGFQSNVFKGTLVVDGGSVLATGISPYPNLVGLGSVLVKNGGSYVGDHITTVGGVGGTDADITVQGSATMSGTTLLLGDGNGASGTFTVTGAGAQANFNSIQFGKPDRNSSWTLRVLDGGVVTVTGPTTFAKVGHSLVVDNAFFSTDELNSTIQASIALSDSAAGSALTVGTANGSSSFAGLISDASGGPGSIEKVGAGTFTLTNAANSYSGGTFINGGTVAVNNSSMLGTGKITLDGGTLELTGSSTINQRLVVNAGDGTIIAPATIELGYATRLKNGSMLTAATGFDLAAGATLTTSGNSLIRGDFTNNGTVEIEAGKTLVFDDDVDGAGDYLNIGTVQFNQEFSPGNSPAEVLLEGNLALVDTSVLNIEIGGSTPGADYDVINVSGLAQFAGELDVKLLNAFDPLVGQQFEIAHYSSYIGEFFVYDLPTFSDPNLGWAVDYGANTLTLSVTAAVPEPSALALMVLAAFGGGAAVWRRRKRS